MACTGLPITTADAGEKLSAHKAAHIALTVAIRFILASSRKFVRPSAAQGLKRRGVHVGVAAGEHLSTNGALGL